MNDLVEDLIQSVTAHQVAPRFHNEREPQVRIQSERPEHFAMVALFVRGMTQTEIAEELNYSVGQVSQVLRQEWARDRIFSLVSKNGGNVVQEMLRLEVLPSIMKLVDLRDDTTGSVPASVQARAADSLLDRYLGKAVQKVETYDGGKVPTVDDAAKLDEAIAASEREIARLAGSTENSEAKPNLLSTAQPVKANP